MVGAITIEPLAILPGTKTPVSYRASCRRMDNGRPVVEFGRTRTKAIEFMTARLKELGLS